MTPAAPAAITGPYRVATAAHWRRPARRFLRLGLILATAGTVALVTLTAVILARSHSTARNLASTGAAILDTSRAYAALTDADRVAADSYLSGGAEDLGGPGSRYQDDVKTASQQLEKAAADGAGGPGGSDELGQVGGLVVSYSGLVDQAHANRGGRALGTAYLTYASTLLHQPDGLLARLDAIRATDLARARSERSAFWLSGTAVAVVALAGAGLVGYLGYLQLACARRFRRVFSPGLLAATVGIAVITAAAALHLADASGAASHRAGPALERLAGVWTARAGVRDVFGQVDRALIGGTGVPAPPPALAGQTAAAGAGPQYARFAAALGATRTASPSAATALALGGGSGTVGAGFAAVEQRLATTGTVAADQFGVATGQAADLGSLPVTLLVCALLALAGAAAGVLPRLSEYRL